MQSLFGLRSRINSALFSNNALLLSVLSKALPFAILYIIAIPAIVFFAKGTISESFSYSVLLAFLLLVFPILLACFWYSQKWLDSYRFILEDQYLIIRSGVFTENITMTPYPNIQDVHIVQGIVERIFGIWSIHVFTATTGSLDSVVIPFLGDSASPFREELLKRIREAKHVTD